MQICVILNVPLKGKFSIGTEGALASKFNYDFEKKKLSRSDALYLFLKVFYVYLSKIYTETAEISKKLQCRSQNVTFHENTFSLHFYIWYVRAKIIVHAFVI